MIVLVFVFYVSFIMNNTRDAANVEELGEEVARCHVSAAVATAEPVVHAAAKESSFGDNTTPLTALMSAWKSSISGP